ncbi:hypothetical protein [Kaarinaea lacus]
MRKSKALFTGGLLLLVTQLVNADPGQPTFMPALYGDGEVWGTKGTTSLPAPNGNNLQSFDNLYVITNFNNPNAVQLPVSEAAPGNPKYNGGRWYLHTVAWTQAGFIAYGGFAPVVKSEDEIKYNEEMGYLVITPGEVFFQCPLLPVK